MTWFGIILVGWYILSIGSSFYIIGNDGTEVSPGSAFISMIISTLFLIGLFTVGTGLM